MLSLRANEHQTCVRAHPRVGLADRPAALVDQPVVHPAQEQPVEQVAAASPRPRNPVVGVGVGAGTVTAREAATAVAKRQRLALSCREETDGTAEVERF